MKKIIIIGCPGSGKSTFAVKLSDKLQLPLYHLDLIYHKPDKTTVSRDEFDRKLTEIMQTDTWIIDGNYSRTVEMRLKECDTVFLLDFPTDICIEGAKSRVGVKQPSLPWVETELDPEFGEFIINFKATTLPKIYGLLEKYKQGKEIVVFKSREETDKYLK